MKNNKVGILYICTGEYWRFWESFYQSCEKYLLQECELHYFLFTDNANLLSIDKSNIHPVFQGNLEWPYITLFRYKIFDENSLIFKDMDYLIFCNANLQFVNSIALDEITHQKNMFVTMHPGFVKTLHYSLPFEKNIDSMAYIKSNNNSKYICGGFNGGKRLNFLNMSAMLNNAIKKDLEKGIIARWHDESHLNNFYNTNYLSFNILPSYYCLPESKIKGVDSEYKIIVLDKDKIIGVRNKGLNYMFCYYVVK